MCSNIVKERAYLKVHCPYTDFFIANGWEIIRGEKWIQLPYEITESAVIVQLSSPISQIMTMSEIPPHAIMMSFVLAALQAP